MQNENEEPMLIGVNEASKLIGIGRNTLLQMIKIKGFPVISTSGKHYIIRNELGEWLSRNRGIYKK